MSDGFWAYGSELRIGDGADPENFTSIPGCESFTGPEQTRDMIEFFTHSSPGGYKERRSGARDSGKVAGNIVWYGDDAAQNELVTAYGVDTPTNFQVKIAGIAVNNIFTFAGYVETLGNEQPTDNLYKRTVSIQVTGPVTPSTE